MLKDFRSTPLYQQAEALCRTLRRPGMGQISDAAEVSISPNGEDAVFAGTLVDALEGVPQTRICSTKLADGDTRVLTFGPNNDRFPKYSPDGRHVAFISDRHKVGDFQLYLLDPVSGGARSTPPVDGWVEYLHWSPNGRQILLGVAGHGADVAGGQGAVTTKQAERAAPAWMPAVESDDEGFRWRRAWVYDLAAGSVRQVSRNEENIWEAAWCGNQAICAVVSAGPSEGLWYTARLRIIEISTANSRELYAPRDQIGWPATSPSGRHLAIVEGVCSDRWIVAGDLLLIDVASGLTLPLDTQGVDVTYTEWRSDQRLLLAGHRGPDTVVGMYDIATATFAEIWSSRDVTTGGRYVCLSGLHEAGDCLLVGESYVRAPEIGIIQRGEYRTIRSFDLGYSEEAKDIESVEFLEWTAPDGLNIQGWLLLPKGTPPHPLVLNIHGGPVSHWRPSWLGRPRGLPILLMLKRGYAVFLPNPRGSSGRGQAFARRVLGEMGGADTYDYLSGLDHLVERRVADPKRLGVTGGSYGGYMTLWLITQDPRFAAAVASSPVANHVTEHLLSNIPTFVSLFLADKYNNPGGKYFKRSPIMHAYQVRTPTLNSCGALDRCTPPQEALQFHNALLEHGVKSVLITYPEEGHGIRKFPAVIDYAARLVAWFEEHMPAKP